ncbi:immunity 17 family protein [Massilibacteroides sp.]|uniref:immunity 17 family protein n=1 Tax=Massilibacteroides sp. TaxID=2034766 RepID=UPI0026324865|nr:immunity 17 family protein [Massilibacteroides sp.]MDD4516260.1 immunity 17 family protein [Massilibacteroides sp.]
MSASEKFIFFLFLSLGAFSLIAAIRNSDWYFSTHGAKMFIKWFGRSGARIFYGLLGLTLIACGIIGLLAGR